MWWESFSAQTVWGLVLSWGLRHVETSRTLGVKVWTLAMMGEGLDSGEAVPGVNIHTDPSWVSLSSEEREASLTAVSSSGPTSSSHHSPLWPAALAGPGAQVKFSRLIFPLRAAYNGLWFLLLRGNPLIRRRGGALKCLCLEAGCQEIRVSACPQQAFIEKQSVALCELGLGQGGEGVGLHRTVF